MPFPELHFPQPQDLKASTVCGSGELQKEMRTAFRTAKVGGPTERLSKLVDHWLQPLVQGLPSYLKDSTHLLQTLQEWKMSLGAIPEEMLIVTIDVVALYPSIPHEEVTVSLREMTVQTKHRVTQHNLKHHTTSNNTTQHNLKRHTSHHIQQHNTP
ncbi:hypothetical protein ACOMHN_056536 [Nucella lapillus]